MFRGKGGRTSPESLTSVCSRCHSLIHAGLLELRGTAPGKLTWTPLGETLGLEPTATAPIAADALPVFRIECASAHSREEPTHAQAVRSVLRNQGFRKAEVEEKLRRAVELLAGKPHEFGELLKTAFSGRLQQR